MKVAIVIPVYKAKPDEDELLSLKYLEKYLKKYDKYFIAPDGLKTSKYLLKDVSVINFPKKFFLSRQSYNQLLLQEDFYQKFKRYDYILIYQTDALVLSDQLLYWCKKNYSYIAAPWFSSLIGYFSHKKNFPDSGGNGGFSLRKVSHAIEVLEKVNKTALRKSESKLVQRSWFIKAVLSGKSHSRWLNAPADNYPFNEDGFWALEAPKYLKDYRVGPLEEAVQFAFEAKPEDCFKLNKNKLPFGTHAWKKYGEKFWKTFIKEK